MGFSRWQYIIFPFHENGTIPAVQQTLVETLYWVSNIQISSTSSPRTRHPPPLANSLPSHGRFDIDQGSAVEAVEPRDGQDVAGNGSDR